MSNQEILEAAKTQAAREFGQEEFRRLVDEEKARLRRNQNRSLWQRLLQMLPFQTRSKP